jgi:hypothetical protein
MDTTFFRHPSVLGREELSLLLHGILKFHVEPRRIYLCTSTCLAQIRQ